eukprot:12454482-Alexandrium_andersonii.AAC.1
MPPSSCRRMPPAPPRPSLQETHVLLHVDDVGDAAEHLSHLGGSGIPRGERVGGVMVDLGLRR